MAEEEKKGASRNLLDTKFGTVDASSIVAKEDKGGKPFIVAKMTTAGGKEIDVYARGKNIDVLKAKAEAGEPFLATGELLARGKGLSLSSVDGKEYSGKVVEVTKEGSNDYGDWKAVKLQVEGKDKPWSVLLTGDDAEKAVKDADITVNLAWTAGQIDGRWMTSAVSSASLKREPKKELENEGPSA